MLEMEHKGLATPKKEEVENRIAEHFKTDKEKVEVVFIFSEYGVSRSRVKARVWEQPVKKEKPKEKPKEEAVEVKEGENEA